MNKLQEARTFIKDDKSKMGDKKKQAKVGQSASDVNATRPIKDVEDRRR